MKPAPLLVLLLAVAAAAAAAKSPFAPWRLGTGVTEAAVADAAWEDTNAETLAKARACLPPVLQGVYVANLTAATNATTEPTAALQCEQLILFHAYERLSTAHNISRALAHGVRLCAHFLDVYQDDMALAPAALPRRSLVATVALVEAAIAALPTRSARTAVYDAFRFRASNGTLCLRRYTVHGRVPTYLV